MWGSVIRNETSVRVVIPAGCVAVQKGACVLQASSRDPNVILQRQKARLFALPGEKIKKSHSSTCDNSWHLRTST